MSKEKEKNTNHLKHYGQKILILYGSPIPNYTKYQLNMFFTGPSVNLVNVWSGYFGSVRPALVGGDLGRSPLSERVGRRRPGSEPSLGEGWTEVHQEPRCGDEMSVRVHTSRNTVVRLHYFNPEHCSPLILLQP